MKKTIPCILLILSVGISNVQASDGRKEPGFFQKERYRGTQHSFRSFAGAPAHSDQEELQRLLDYRSEQENEQRENLLLHHHGKCRQEDYDERHSCQQLVGYPRRRKR